MAKTLEIEVEEFTENTGKEITVGLTGDIDLNKKNKSFSTYLSVISTLHGLMKSYPSCRISIERIDKKLKHYNNPLMDSKIKEVWKSIRIYAEFYNKTI